MSLDVPSILYSVINEIGKGRIRTDVFSDITLSQVHCEEILKRCKVKLGNRASQEVIANICEGLLHFMLTISMLPSQRKLVVRGIEVDVVIPSARGLLNNPEKSIVIQVIKTDVEAAKIENAKRLQPNIENIWVISSRQLLTSCRKYEFDSDNSFVRIIMDIHSFVTSRGITGLKLFHGD